MSFVVNFKKGWQLLRDTISKSGRDNLPRLGAALAYYSLFAIGPLFLVVLAVADFWFGETTARQGLSDQLSQLVGAAGAKAVENIIASVHGSSASRPTFLAVGALFIAGTGVFVELQGALNTIWNVPRPAGSGFWKFLKTRALSFAALLSLAFLLLVSLLLSLILSALFHVMRGWLPAERTLGEAANLVLSILIIALLFAGIFKVLPNVTIPWRNVWIGGFLTSLLFNFGKFLLALYLSRNSTTSAYGAAGSLVIVIIWVYYSAQILLFGAEFTCVYSKKYDSRFQESTPTRDSHPANTPPQGNRISPA